MNKDVKYNGYSAQPSDYECPDGELSLALNLVPEDGAIHPITPPVPVFQPSSQSLKAIYIHKTSAFTHYILFDEQADTNNVYWFSWVDSDDIDRDTRQLKPGKSPIDFYPIDTSDVATQIEAVGNTLIILINGRLNYFLWQAGKSQYIFLGNRLPEISLSFGLKVEMVFTDPYDISTQGLPNNGQQFDSFTADSENGIMRRDAVTQSVLGQINKYIAEQSNKNGRFLMPFFVRYALRLFDGSLVLHSSPVLMIPAAAQNPTVVAFYFTRDGYPNTFDVAVCRTAGIVASLDYRLIDPPSRIAEIREKWGDIISSVDIFISKPIYIYDQNGYVTGIMGHQLNDDLAIHGQLGHGGYAMGSFRGGAYGLHTFPALWGATYGEYEGASFAIPRRDDKAVKRDIESNSLFYFLKSYTLDQLSTVRTTIDIPKDYLGSLVTREVMTDDYDSHDTLMPAMIYAYNSRLNLAGGKKKPFSLLAPDDIFPYAGPSATQIDSAMQPCTPIYCISQDGRDIALSGKAGLLCTDVPVPPWMFFPNVNAKKAILQIGTDSGMSYCELPLKKHDFLNGSYYCRSLDTSDTPPILPASSYAPPIPAPESDTIVLMPNKVYTSQVNNPFYFPVSSINSVGTGTIMSLCTAAKALSQGQFGQFPLYAFTTEGVWAMEVSATGTYSARQPITRDVCTNPAAITQLDSAVLFPTDRGIMLISGSQTQCITDSINSEYPFDITSLPGIADLHDRLGHTTATDRCFPILPFSAFLSQCRMIYDYVHQRVIAYVPGVTYAYVFSLKSKLWGMTFSTIERHLNSYPDALAVDAAHNTLVSFSESSGDDVGSMLVSRPLKLGMADVQKTVDTIIQRGRFRKGHVQSVLYGSRDLSNWHLVWSSKDHFLRGFRGTPYKYFRVALLCNLSPDESIYGASVQFTPRLTNQPR